MNYTPDIFTPITPNPATSNRGTMIMPVEIAITFGSEPPTIVKLPVEMWNLGSSFTYRVPQRRAASRAEMDPRQVLPDIDRSNNSKRIEGSN